MQPDQRLIPRILSLPIECRRALCEQDGAGWWVDPDGRDVLSARAIHDEHDWKLLAGGWAWWPADSAAWMRATDRRWKVEVYRDGLVVWDVAKGSGFGSSAPEAALAYWEGAR